VPTYSRRRFLAAGTGLVLAGPSLLAACGKDDPGSGSGGGNREGLALLPFLAPGTVATGAQRWAIGVGDTDAMLGVDELPSTLTVQFLFDGKELGSPMSAPRHAEGLPRPYYPYRTTFTAPGTYDVVATIDGQEATMAFALVPPEQVPIPKVGDKLPAAETPTTADGHGVDPICTRKPTCPLHEVTLTEALGEGKPVGLLIATPAYCQTAVCGPVLDVVLAASEGLTDKVRLVHAEVYSDDTLASQAPVVSAYGMTFEPCLYLADASGTIVDRLDVLFDTAEVRTALEQLAA